MYIYIYAQREWLGIVTGMQRGCGISILEEFQNPSGQSPQRPDLTLKLALLETEGCTTWPPELPPRLTTSIKLQFQTCFVPKWKKTQTQSCDASSKAEYFF